jgi:acetyltransferase
VPIFYSPAGLARGLKILLDYHTWRQRRQCRGFAVVRPLTPEQLAARRWLAGLKQRTLSEFDSKRLIATWGVPGTREARAASASEAVAVAERLGYPVVLKADSAHLQHKTEAGAIRLGLRDAEQVAHAMQELGTRVLVQEMVTNSLEMIVGVAYDEQLGPMLLFGSGGIDVEVYRDISLRRCPITAAEAFEMISEVKGARLLRGFRGRPPADVDALAETLANVSQLAAHLEDQLAELDINPLMVLPAGQGVKAADALVILRE